MAAFLKKLLILVPVGLGLLVVMYAVTSREGPRRVAPEERTTSVRVVPAAAVDVAPRALGYGNVKPGRVWEAVAEVSGTVVFRHPELRRGAILAAGTELLRIDPADYRLAAKQIEANIRAVEAQIAVLEARAVNTERSLAIEERSLSLNRKQFERTRELLRRGAVSQSDADREERSVLAGEQAVQNLRNAAKLIPAERAVQEAARDQLKAQLETARRNLSRTTIVAPFTCRIAAVSVELAQFATKGQVLVEADSLDVAEIIAQVPIGRALTLLPPDFELPREPGSVVPRLREMVDIQAAVRLRTGDVDIEWPARFSRMSDPVAPRTRTAGVIVAVAQPYRRVASGLRPPLVKNMYVEVELRGPPRLDAVVIPRAGLRDGHVYVAGPDQRLHFREVQVDFVQTNVVVLRSGLEPGEPVVISDLPFAVEGMRLATVVDQAAADSLAAEAPVR
ncbi:MAG: efflux RND transporter periplasmic adaptor subunit [Deltaproteobacteria bacterium]|nr:efflux RND transporter periplasmic adaptor subunit [Deltaproteobacteria bacterium]